MAMPAMSPEPDHLPLSPLLHRPGPLATVRQRAPWQALAPPWSKERRPDAGRRAPAHALDAARVARMHDADTHWTRAAPRPRAPPGPPASTLSITVTPQRSQTRPRPRPATAVAGEENPGPPRTRRTRKQCDLTQPPPTALSPPNASPGRGEPDSTLAEPNRSPESPRACRLRRSPHGRSLAYKRRAPLVDLSTPSPSPLLT
jgi:hypothetical protein